MWRLLKTDMKSVENNHCSPHLQQTGCDKCVVQPQVNYFKQLNITRGNWLIRVSKNDAVIVQPWFVTIVSIVEKMPICDS
jgi:hypothetical protein